MAWGEIQDRDMRRYDAAVVEIGAYFINLPMYAPFFAAFVMYSLPIMPAGAQGCEQHAFVLLARL